ncbi:MAG: VWA domain-containing protein [Chromatiales bacterium]|nr:VWA domain-containing protein [Chromatiales bacterium]
MKTKLIALSLFATTAVAVALFPTLNGALAIPQVAVTPVVTPINQLASERAMVEAVFVLDTTGSMSGLIEAAKEKIWSIANTMAQADPAPEIRIGLVAYRDRGDAYVTKVVDLSSDLDSVYATLMDFRADGGGDGPESVNQALDDALNRVSWSQETQGYRVIFLVGDAPAHMDYQDDVKYPVTIARAKQRGIVINAIQSGNSGDTSKMWQQIASLGSGDFFQVEQDGNAVAVATPFDEEMAELSAKLDETRLYYGSEEKKAEKRKKVAAGEKLRDASTASQARRAAFNSSKSGMVNLFGDSELVDDVASGRIAIDEIEEEKLPEPLQAMAPAERAEVITQKAEERKSLQAKIKTLAEERSRYIRDKVAAEGGAEDSLDEKIYSAVREQALGKGLRYEAESADY